MAEVTRAQYADAVIAAIAGDFPDLRDPVVVASVRESLTRGAVEVIVDDPISANWRLLWGQITNRFRLACFRLHPTQADRERLARLNAALEALEASDD